MPQIFDFQGNQVRTTQEGEEVWFVAKDVCEVLELKNTTMTLKRLDEDEKAKLNLGLRGGDTNCVNKFGLYNLVLRSEKPQAKPFQRWVTHEVLPAIRQDGGYMATTEGDNEQEPTQMENLTIIHKQAVLGRNFKVYGTTEEPLFLAKDVAEWIEYGVKNAYRLYDMVEGDERKTCSTYFGGQLREMKFLTEDGLYEVLMQSRKPLAKQFKKQVKQIMNTIRKHGAYMTPDTLETASSLFSPFVPQKIFSIFLFP
ncbi:prophage antirepressor-like protein [Scopulibacillus darangshiensis]|uniref:Prophage antirepressor-like protein n=1 Tax=Scopulibacillus darangshiensis TaxID=442528 RepID=A0A4R2P2J4_9BACL|nr:BRO family protein [Scopulibacillus darangshiensis]TCP28787.1 prophage antirepressor-like protein [Scopulibacillus darangshiensis]